MKLNAQPSVLKRSLKKSLWLASASVLFSCFIACETKDSSDSGGAAGEGGNGDQNQENTAYLAFSRIKTLEGRTMYSSILDELDVGAIDLGDALESPGVSRARVFEEKLYVFDGENGNIERYLVDEQNQVQLDTLDDGREARMSLQSLGIQIFSSNIAFVSATQAFVFETISTDLVVEFNPTEMTITQYFAANLDRDGFETTGGSISVFGDYLVMPVSYLNFFLGTAVESTAIAVLDLKDPTELEIIEDERCIGASSTFVYEQSIYVVADNFGGWAQVIDREQGWPDPCILRYQPGEDAFDSEYLLNLKEASGYQAVSYAVSNNKGGLLLNAFTADIAISDLDFQTIREGAYWQRILLDMKTEKASLYGDLPPGVATFPAWLIDGEFVAPVVQKENASSTPNSKLYRLTEDSSEELLSVQGEIFLIDRIR